MSNLQWYWCSKQHTFIIQASCSCSCASSCSSLFWMQFHSLSHGHSFPWVLCGTVAVIVSAFLGEIRRRCASVLLWQFRFVTALYYFSCSVIRLGFLPFFSCAPYQFLEPIELGYLEELEIHCLIKAIAFSASHTCRRIPRKLTGETKSISTSRRRSCGI